VSDVAIDEFLSSLGLAGADAERARAVLEERRITNPRKSRISTAKLEQATEAVDRAMARLCHSCASRVDPRERPVVQVPTPACGHCGGSRTSRALDELVQACATAGIRKLVVVGGSPDIRRELRAVGPQLELRLVDGTERRRRGDADRDLAWADAVVVCGGSELAHKVSTLYTRAGAGHVVTSSRRGIEAIAGAVVDHARRR
jgi:hypothetical protein